MSNNLAQSPIKVSSKQDIILQHLQDHKAALRVIQRHNLVEEYNEERAVNNNNKRAIGAPAPIPKATLGFGNNLVIETY